jgi:hypothetical protein
MINDVEIKCPICGRMFKSASASYQVEKYGIDSLDITHLVCGYGRCPQIALNEIMKVDGEIR